MTASKIQKGILYGIQCGKCHHIPHRDYVTLSYHIKSILEGKTSEQNWDCVATAKIHGSLETLWIGLGIGLWKISFYV